MKHSEKQRTGEHPHYQDIVLIGGGHSHSVFLQLWAKRPLPGVRVTLVSPQVLSTYSGMLAGMIAGHYSYSDIHIDLPALCQAAGARFVQACAHHIDPVEKTVSLLGRPDLEYDLISLDIGATPCRQIPGSELAIPVKPVGHFHRYWQQLKQQIDHQHRPLRLGVVGGGLGGCELAMAMASALEEPVYSGRVEIHLLHASGKLPQEFSLLGRRLVARELGRLGVRAHRNWRVSEITPCGVHSDEGEFLALDKVLLCTEAGAPPWLTQSGLALDPQGFVRVDEYLRAEQHPSVFAVGDVASPVSDGQRRPQRRRHRRSARNALNQGPALFHNLRATLLEQPLTAYRESRRFFHRLACGGQRAIVARGGFAAVGSLMWHWKDLHDRRQMQAFEAAAEAQNEAPRQRVPARLSALWRTLTQPAPCGLGQRNNISVAGLRHHSPAATSEAGLLDRALASLPQPQPIASTLARGQDTATITLPADQALVQRSSQITVPVADPWLYGRLSALHALTALLTAHAQPCTAQALVTLPPGAPEMAARDLLQLLDGAARELNQHNCALSGGSANTGSALHLGLTVSGIVDPQQRQCESLGARAGDCLILTKPIGTGALFAAECQGKARGRWLQQALEMMLQSNATAADIFTDHHAHGLRNIGDAGLLGELLTLLKWRTHRAAHSRQGAQATAPHLGAQLLTESLPLLPGATCCAGHGFLSAQHQHNARAYDALQNPTPWRADPLLPLLVDPQTCGGLLAAVPAEHAQNCLAELQAAGCRYAAIIGVVDELSQSGEQQLYATQPVHLVKGGDWNLLAQRPSAVTS
ncbi:selenide, water dikinase SelD [Microbulbifer salipaludis]|uniref:Selenide, water dikinase SelD n=1 Tax=Microbulbifer salipaludis TaxID=187980 RepID=A0ABS3E570_9GAMM|nr:selenide, water dikinase SelD [Microbulbifer salipaludis]